MAKVAHESNTTRPVESYGTSKDSVVAQLDNLTVKDVFGVDMKDPIVIAKDKDGSLYPTAKSIVGSGLLDPYKMYRRMDAKEVDGKYEFTKRV